MFDKVETPRVADAIVRQIETLILQGILKPGDRLPPERDLSLEMNVSRPKLREALSNLEERGLLVTRHGDGTRIAQVIGPIYRKPMLDLFARHKQAAQDFLEFRRELEPAAAELAALRATTSDLKILADLRERMITANSVEDADAENRLDIEFHMAITDASHNIVLIQTMRSLNHFLAQDIFENRAAIFDHRGSLEVILEQHLSIHDALITRDADAARMAMRRHIDFIIETTRELMLKQSRESTAGKRLLQTGKTRKNG